jgi:hypothetical protein
MALCLLGELNRTWTWSIRFYRIWFMAFRRF